MRPLGASGSPAAAGSGFTWSGSMAEPLLVESGHGKRAGICLSPLAAYAIHISGRGDSRQPAEAREPRDESHPASRSHLRALAATRDEAAALPPPPACGGEGRGGGRCRIGRGGGRRVRGARRVRGVTGAQASKPFQLHERPPPLAPPHRRRGEGDRASSILAALVSRSCVGYPSGQPTGDGCVNVVARRGGDGPGRGQWRHGRRCGERTRKPFMRSTP
jgi:hypothetical protein